MNPAPAWGTALDPPPRPLWLPSPTMADDRPVLTLAHSADPDDAFMWWPITGKVNPDGTPRAKGRTAVIDTGRFRFRAIPGDIEAFNRRAAEVGDYDITALSARAYADVRDRYAITSCGSSFGEGYGPKLVCRDADAYLRDAGSFMLTDLTIAVPGRRTTAFMTLCLLLGKSVVGDGSRFIDVPFDRVIPTVRDGGADAGLVIHEGQVTFKDAGLRQLTDLGEWWQKTTNLPLPLGINAVRRDLDERFGEGSTAEVVRTLRSAIAHALANRQEGLEYAVPFAAANAKASGTKPPTIEGIDAYVAMYVTDLTVGLDKTGRDAIRRILRDGAAAGLCPDVGGIDIV